MKVLKFASIDIGSNALRLLIMHVVENTGEPIFRKSSLIRVPVRLGADAFTRGVIPKQSVDLLVHSMHAYRHLMTAHQVLDYRGCATSAMREAKNGNTIVKKVRNETGINIQIIDGKTEAEVIYSTQIAEHLSKTKKYLYVDVGGGSTEITLFSKGVPVDSYSFNIGTIRLLNNMVSDQHWNELKKWLRSITKKQIPSALIGSGGNINKVMKMSGKRMGRPLLYQGIKEMYKSIKLLSVDDRIRLLDMNPDRADVIIPALDIYMNIMKWIGVETIFVPKIGLADGLVRLIYKDYYKNHDKRNWYKPVYPT